MNKRLFLPVALCLLFAGCDDSTATLSDAKTAKLDEHLLGDWKQVMEKGEAIYHIEKAGKKLPAGVVLIRVTGKEENGVAKTPSDYLAFTTTIDGTTYLNVVIDNEHVAKLTAEGWKADFATNYGLYRYKIDGDKASLWVLDDDAKKQAISDGKIQGKLPDSGNTRPAMFTDTSAKLASFVAKSGDSIWATKDAVHFVRAQNQTTK